jgi:hypothetical protein
MRIFFLLFRFFFRLMGDEEDPEGATSDALLQFLLMEFSAHLHIYHLLPKLTWLPFSSWAIYEILDYHTAHVEGTAGRCWGARRYVGMVGSRSYSFHVQRFPFFDAELPRKVGTLCMRTSAVVAHAGAVPSRTHRDARCTMHELRHSGTRALNDGRLDARRRWAVHRVDVDRLPPARGDGRAGNGAHEAMGWDVR